MCVAPVEKKIKKRISSELKASSKFSPPPHTLFLCMLMWGAGEERVKKERQQAVAFIERHPRFSNAVADVMSWTLGLCILAANLLHGMLVLGMVLALCAVPLEYCCGQTLPLECEGVFQSVCAYTGQPYGILHVLHAAAAWTGDVTEDPYGILRALNATAAWTRDITETMTESTQW